MQFGAASVGEKGAVLFSKGRGLRGKVPRDRESPSKKRTFPQQGPIPRNKSSGRARCHDSASLGVGVSCPAKIEGGRKNAPSLWRPGVKQDIFTPPCYGRRGSPREGTRAKRKRASFPERVRGKGNPRREASRGQKSGLCVQEQIRRWG